MFVFEDRSFETASCNGSGIANVLNSDFLIWALNLKPTIDQTSINFIMGMDPLNGQTAAQCTNPDTGDADPCLTCESLRDNSFSLVNTHSVCDHDSWGTFVSDQIKSQVDIRDSWKLTYQPDADCLDIDDDGDRSELGINVYLDRNDGAGWIQPRS